MDQGEYEHAAARMMDILPYLRDCSDEHVKKVFDVAAALAPTLLEVAPLVVVQWISEIVDAAHDREDDCKNPEVWTFPHLVAGVQRLVRLEMDVVRNGRSRRITERAIGTEATEAVKRLLHHSWREIDYQYAALTEDEKACIDEEDFLKVLDWLRGNE